MQNNQNPIEQILENIERVIIGKHNVAELCLVALLAKGHVLLEDVPGVGKTLLVKALAKSIAASFKRIQFTPDLLPADVTGLSVYNPEKHDFLFRPGPIMGNIILADEINRTSPKTQSALLEAMEEHSVTVDGVSHKLPNLFFVMATQNPIEYEGTYILPEAQLDRFLLKTRMGYPDLQDELDILLNKRQSERLEELEPVMDLADMVEMQRKAQQIYVDETVARYIVELTARTRTDKRLYLGVSPRGSVSLMRAAQALAFIRGRDFCTPDDIQYLVPYVYEHRLILKPEMAYEGYDSSMVLNEILAKTPVPVQRQVYGR